MLTVAQIIVQNKIPRIEPDGLLELLDGLFMQPLRLVINSQPRMKLLQRVVILHVLLVELLADDLVVFDGFLAVPESREDGGDGPVGL